MPDTYRYPLSVAGLSLLMETDQHLPEHEAFTPFLTEAGTPDFHITYREVSQLPPIPDVVIHEEQCYRVHPDGKGGYFRSFFDPPRDQSPYGVAVFDYDRGRVQVEYLEKGRRCVSELRNSFFHLSLESILIHRQKPCLHAACVETALGGILFSGPSGIGKSTQAKLWCDFRNARQINGDRPILDKGEHGWMAWGSPYAGSSRVYVNDCCPVTAVVMLRQEKQCRLRRMTLPEAFRAVWSGLTVHSWDRYFVETASDLAMDLIGCVPVFEFGCTPEEEAVTCLEQALRKELRL